MPRFLNRIAYLKDVREEDVRGWQETAGRWDRACIRPKEGYLRAEGLTFFVFYVVQVDFEGSNGNQYFCDGDSERGDEKQKGEAENID